MISCPRASPSPFLVPRLARSRHGHRAVTRPHFPTPPAACRRAALGRGRSFRYPLSADRPGIHLTPGDAGCGRRTLLPLLPGALLCPAAPVRGPARRLHRPLPPEGRGPALRLRLRRLPPTGGAVPGPLRRRPAAPLFSAPRPGPPGPRATAAAQAERPAIADCRALGLAPGRHLRTRVAGLFLFLPLLARLNFADLVRQAGYPGSRMVPAPAALLSLLALKLLDKERRSHIDDFNCDEALGLFAGLNVLPKKSYATDYSYRTHR